MHNYKYHKMLEEVHAPVYARRRTDMATKSSNAINTRPSSIAREYRFKTVSMARCDNLYPSKKTHTHALLVPSKHDTQTPLDCRSYRSSRGCSDQVREPQCIPIGFGRTNEKFAAKMQDTEEVRGTPCTA